MVALMIVTALALAAVVFVYLNAAQPMIPAFVVVYYDTLFNWMHQASGILDFFCPFEYMSAIFFVWLVLHAMHWGYLVIRWFFGFIK